MLYEYINQLLFDLIALPLLTAFSFFIHLRLIFSHLLVSGGRSRLHLLDLGSCDVKALGGGGGGGGGGGKSRENSSTSSAPLCLSLSALGNVILALVNGSKHIPYK